MQAAEPLGLSLAAGTWSRLPADFHVLRRGTDPPAGAATDF